MTGAQAAWLRDGRLHLQHGPIDLLIGAEGPGAEQAFAAAARRFPNLLPELVEELPLLRSAVSDRIPLGPVARRMYKAAQRHRDTGFVTSMAAVAGAVADEILTVMRTAGDLTRAYVNNGGDIALHLGGAARFTVSMRSVVNTELGDVTLKAGDAIGGVATSGRGGRSLSLGIADSVTVLARDAATADVAATLIANAVDLPGRRAISRTPACELDPDSDLGERLVVTDCAPLGSADIDRALRSGLARAKAMRRDGLIAAAALTLFGETRTLDLSAPVESKGICAYA